MASTTVTTTLRASLRSRPLRFAFLIDPEATSSDLIRRIIDDSLHYWGGRYYGIFPLTDGDVAGDWWQPLYLLDPDLLVTFAPLSDGCRKRVERSILPLKILGLEESERQRLQDMHPVSNSGIRPVTTHDLPPYIWARRGGLFDPIFMVLSDVSADTVEGQAIACNFGVASQDVFAKSSFEKVKTEDVNCSTTTLDKILERIVELADRAILQSDLASSFTGFPRRLKHDPFCEAFHLVVGDGVLDRIYAWNRGHMSGPGPRRRSFWLPEDLMTHPDLLKALVPYVERHAWTTGNYRKCIVVSYSLDDSDLRSFADSLPDVPWDLDITCKHLSPTEYPFPEPLEPTMPDASLPLLGGDWHEHSRITTQQVLFGEDAALVHPEGIPFSGGPSRDSQFMVDAQVECKSTRYNYSNNRPSWTLPKRPQLGELFFPSQESRIVSGGLPSTLVSIDKKAVQLAVPDLRTLFHHIILNKHLVHITSSSPTAAPRFQAIATSAEGGFLQGVMRLCGNLFTCEHVFGDEYWRTVLLEMAKTRRARHQWNTLNGLMQQYGKIRQEALNSPDSNTSYWNKGFNDFRRREFNDLVADGIFKQGVEIQCRVCGSSFWYSSDEFSPTMACLGCGAGVELLPEAKWAYRINELVASALRRGTLPVLSALSQLRREAHGMFLALPCQNIHESPDDPELTDIDIVALLGSRFVIGEAKASPGGFTEDDCKKLFAVAADIVPDEVIFAARGQQWPTDIQQRLAAIAADLSTLAVRGESP